MNFSRLIPVLLLIFLLDVQSARAQTCYGVKPLPPICVSGKGGAVCVCDQYGLNCKWQPACFKRGQSSYTQLPHLNSPLPMVQTARTDPSIANAGLIDAHRAPAPSKEAAAINGILRGLERGLSMRQKLAAIKQRRAKERVLQLQHQVLQKKLVEEIRGRKIASIRRSQKEALADAGVK